MATELKTLVDECRDLKHNIDDMIYDIINDVCDVLEVEIREIYNKVIDDYYASYDRKYYRPTRSLYDAYKIYRTKNSFNWDDDDPNLIADTHRVSSEYIYEHMFVGGWHGGANYNGHMVIPVRTPPKPYDGAEKPWSESPVHKWIGAEQSQSPKEAANELIEEKKEDWDELQVDTAYKYIKKKYPLLYSCL